MPCLAMLLQLLQKKIRTSRPHLGLRQLILIENNCPDSEEISHRCIREGTSLEDLLVEMAADTLREARHSILINAGGDINFIHSYLRKLAQFATASGLKELSEEIEFASHLLCGLGRSGSVWQLTLRHLIFKREMCGY